ncbi:hypothetical protein U9M48_038373 [Paspalum notatum var. saurae]|uniref:Uncharacterized protein n=1 Tax=Paspalum notatum var. saurae TaxID=547442 RepID=A0AAQ3UHV1_PASNO
MTSEVQQLRSMANDSKSDAMVLAAEIEQAKASCAPQEKEARHDLQMYTQTSRSSQAVDYQDAIAKQLADERLLQTATSKGLFGTTVFSQFWDKTMVLENTMDQSFHPSRCVSAFTALSHHVTHPLRADSLPHRDISASPRRRPSPAAGPARPPARRRAASSRSGRAGPPRRHVTRGRPRLPEPPAPPARIRSAGGGAARIRLGPARGRRAKACHSPASPPRPWLRLPACAGPSATACFASPRSPAPPPRPASLPRACRPRRGGLLLRLPTLAGPFATACFASQRSPAPPRRPAAPPPRAGSTPPAVARGTSERRGKGAGRLGQA